MSHQKLFIIPPYPAVISNAVFKETPADFIVTEQFDFDFTGEGEHLCILIKKENTNTNQVASALAKWADIPVKDVSFSGLKDKFAVTTQWFSLRIPNKKLPVTTFEFSSEHSNVEILDQQWHLKKLGRGSHKANKFTITLKKVMGEKSAITERLEQIKTEGVPNYFMAQRFGREGNNLDNAHRLFNRQRKFKREERSIILSSARSYLFNQILYQRVQDGTWNRAIIGDVFNINGSGSIFTADIIDDDIRNRVNASDIHPTGAMWGIGKLMNDRDSSDLENSIIKKPENTDLATGLENAGLKQARRPLRLLVQNLTWQFLDDTLIIDFSLPSGSYATAVLACLIDNFYG